MKRILPRLVALSAIVASACAARADTAPHLAIPVEVLFRDDFSRGETGSAWKTNDAAKNAPGQSRIVDGALVTRMAPHSDHGATIHTPVEFTDAVFTCRFRLLDERGFNLPINDQTEKSVHAGHICRVRVAPGRVQLQDDKTGQMNLEVQKLRKDPTTADQAAKRMVGTSSVFDAPVETGKWHTLRVEIAEDEMLVHVDGKPVGYLKSPGLAHRTKRSLGFTVAGATGVIFDDVVLARASRADTWPAQRTGMIATLRPSAAKQRK